MTTSFDLEGDDWAREQKDQEKPEASGETVNVHISSSPQSRSANVIYITHNCVTRIN
jgi:hypothetical protein